MHDLNLTTGLIGSFARINHGDDVDVRVRILAIYLAGNYLRVWVQLVESGTTLVVAAEAIKL
jgi:hypothetical protein